MIYVLDGVYNEEFYRAVGSFVAARSGILECLKPFLSREAFPPSLAGLVPALLRLTTSFELFACDKGSDLVGDCDSLRQFSCHTAFANSHVRAMCHLASCFPSLQRVQFLGTTCQNKTRVSASILDMVRTSQSIEAVDGWPFCDESQNAAIRAKSRINTHSTQLA